MNNREALELARNLIADRTAEATEGTRGNPDPFLNGMRAGFLEVLGIINGLIEADGKP